MRRSFLVLTLAACASLAGCETAVSDDGGDAGRLRQSDWVAESIAGTPVLKPGHVTLSFGEARVSGRSGCNRYFGSAEYGDGIITVGQLGSTKMACQEPGVMAQESRYLTALGSASRYSFGADGRLTIATGAGDLVYRGVAPEGR